MINDAVKASPETHKLLFENDEIRVIEVTIKPGQKEPLHRHMYKSALLIHSPAKLRFTNQQGNLIAEKIEQGIIWRDPEEGHSVENIDQTPFRAYRFELKK